MPKNTTIHGLGKHFAKAQNYTQAKAVQAKDATAAYTRDMNRAQKYTMAGVATLGAAALTLGLATTDAGSTSTTDAAPASATQVKETHTDITNQNAGADQKVKDATAKLGTKTEKAEKKDADSEKAEKAEKSEKKGDKAESKAKADRKDKPAANRSADRKPTYADNLDGWIRESLAIMKDKGIPGSYEGLHRNIIRESAGDPKAINDWDINAINGVPSKGLLQVIPPTFDAYHVKGTPKDIYDPVANITAAANYAADKYGSMDNVDSAY
ncbi:hypothetical protein SLNWT_0642 [Streptomyces albus]|uniref:Transglycosylase SLT domain-containing protein n=2 Tax=Streptomyces TaxID=1883 RepID=A0A0B5EG55_STRA4|nr:hypothetical protein SLNWT_0642 [Streptomyces albus]AOU75330.1 hypothetical protein SLNHY_0639 [Streptomyces albus]